VAGAVVQPPVASERVQQIALQLDLRVLVVL
jgi:hypothetical protein